MERTPYQKLYWLLELYLVKKIDPGTFCDEFFHTYEHELREEITDQEKRLFQYLSRKAARFSNCEEDLAKYPAVYTSKEEMDKIVSEVTGTLKTVEDSEKFRR